MSAWLLCSASRNKYICVVVVISFWGVVCLFVCFGRGLCSCCLYFVVTFYFYFYFGGGGGGGIWWFVCFCCYFLFCSH